MRSPMAGGQVVTNTSISFKPSGVASLAHLIAEQRRVALVLCILDSRQWELAVVTK